MARAPAVPDRPLVMRLKRGMPASKRIRAQVPRRRCCAGSPCATTSAVVHRSCALLRRQPLRCEVDRRSDALVGGTPTDVAGQRMVDVLIGRLRLLLEQRDGGHDLPRLAIAALNDIEIDPGFLYRLGHSGCQTL